MSGSFLQDALIYLATAAIFVPIARKLGLGSILGYLLGGILIGPFFLGFVGEEGKDIMHFAEFGVVMMLFLAGLELEPATVWRLRKFILGAGAVQMAGTTLACFALFLALGFGWQASVAFGLAASMSSSAIIMQIFREKGLSKTLASRSALAVSLFQDISVIPILALLPLMAAAAAVRPPDTPATLIDGMPGWAQTLLLLAVANAVVFAGRFVFVPFLRFIARVRLRELFTAAALLIVTGMSYLMIRIGFSPALGAFLAGVVLAGSEFRHQLESDIEPFKGVLLGLFFIAVGASINFSLIVGNPLLVMGLVVGIVAIKAVVTGATGRLFGLSFDQNVLFTVVLSQIGEFAFVLFAFVGQLRLLPEATINILMGVTATSMIFPPILILATERLLLPYFGTRESVAPREPDANRKRSVRRYHRGLRPFSAAQSDGFLRANGVARDDPGQTITDRVDVLRKMGFTVFYGERDALDILKSAVRGRSQNADRRHRFAGNQPRSDRAGPQRVSEPGDPGARQKPRGRLRSSRRPGWKTSTGSARQRHPPGRRCPSIKLGFRKYSAVRAGQNFLK
jgi:CPA2 family monovalent cation:H+ antiporter-2